MELTVATSDLGTLKTACLILAVFEKRQLSAPALELDAVSGGALAALLESGDMDGDAGRSALLYRVANVAATRVLLVGCGKPEEFDREAYRKILDTACARLAELGVAEAVCATAELPVLGLSLYRKARAAALAAGLSGYRYERTKARKPNARAPLERLAVWIGEASAAASVEQAVAHGGAIAAGANLARELGNLPGNLCTPSYLAEQARAIGGNDSRFDCEALDEEAIATLGMDAFLSVARGSREPARLIVMHYNGGQANDPPVVLIGKGLTFDAGGISIKAAADMDEMKYDMCGGASVIGCMRALLDIDLPLNVIGIVPASENLPDGAANKPGDIVRSLSGQTIEILNTDAEGRLLLCDALTYAERFEPAAVIDVATLTGACIVALGRHPSGLLANDEALAAELLAAGEAIGDRAWRLPLWKDYDSQLDSNFADMANIGGRDGGAITAAAFLARFAKKFKWAHLDIAGTAWLTGKEKGATGRPVPLLMEFLIQRAGLER